MDSGLSIGISALNAERTEIDVASENIANVQTPGYEEETANLEPLPGGDLAGVGTGVEAQSITQASNAMLSANNWQAQGALANLGSLQDILTGIENAFPLGESPASSSSTTSTNSGLSGQLANFWSAWDGIASDPSATAGRTGVITLAQGLSTTFQEASTQLQQLSNNTAVQLGDQVAQLNTLLSQAGNLNNSIVATEGAGGNIDQLQDSMSNVVGQLASIAGVTVRVMPDNTSSIGIGGVTVVQGSSVSTLATSVSGTYGVETSSGVAVPVTSGAIAGLLSGLNVSIPTYSNQLDSVANSLITTVNSQLAQGYTASGASGAAAPLFTGNSASTIGVNSAVVADPTLIAAASTNGSAAANDGSNAQAIAEFANSTTGPDSIFQNLVQELGSATENVNTQVSAQTSVASQAQTALSSATGVNLDNELTNLMNFQNNYEASAKLLGTLDATMQSLIAAV